MINNITFTHSESFNGNLKVTKLAMKIALELASNEDLTCCAVPKPWEEVIVAQVGDTPIGFIQFFECDGILSITLAGVLSEYRNTGVYSQMYTLLRKVGYGRNLNAINCMIQANTSDNMLSHAITNGLSMTKLISIVDELK